MGAHFYCDDRIGEKRQFEYGESIITLLKRIVLVCPYYYQLEFILVSLIGFLCLREAFVGLLFRFGPF